MLANWDVITSYSIHYTKLYDGLPSLLMALASQAASLSHFLMNDALAAPASGLPSLLTALDSVITSYSIHYTKLYDALALFETLMPVAWPLAVHLAISAVYLLTVGIGCWLVTETPVTASESAEISGEVP